MKRLTVLLLACALAAFGLAACGDDDGDSGSATTGTTETTGTTGAGATGGATGDGGSGTASGGTLRVAADPSGALKFTKETLAAEAGSTKVEFENESSVPHNVAFEQDGEAIGKTAVVTSDNATTTVKFKAGEYEYICEVDGHEQAGMKGILTVK